MMLIRCCTALLLTTLAAAVAQNAKPPVWEKENSGTTAGLRGVHAVGGGVVWASGEHGTVLRTEDSGYMWQSCAMPPGAEKLDFRGIWAWDANTAVVMSSGPGDQSRLYKTTDGCSHWVLVFTNPDKDGFWDAMSFTDQDHGVLFGDPVGGTLTLLRTKDAGLHWSPVTTTSSPGLAADPALLGGFAASNTSLALAAQVLNSIDNDNFIYWAITGGTSGAFVLRGQSECEPKMYHQNQARCSLRWIVIRDKVPLASGDPSSGGFSLAVLDGDETLHYAVAVGGDYAKPDQRDGTAAYWSAATNEWRASAVPPGGYRSAIAIYGESPLTDYPDRATWITVGPNGSDLSRDSGKTWQPLEHTASSKPGEWNALSLPWVVGPNGRIAKLNPNALPPPAPTNRSQSAK